jgi:hypothetical protein
VIAKDNRPMIVHDESGLLYLKFICVLTMIFVHTNYYLLLVDGQLATDNGIFHWFEQFFPVGIFPLMLPGTAGAMLMARLKGGRHDSQKKRLSFRESRGVVRTAFVLMVVGLMLNWLLYRHIPNFYPYFQSTLEFLAISFLLLGLCCFIHFDMLFVFALFALWVTANYSELRFVPDAPWFKVLFASDGRQYLWPVFPWVGLVAFGGALQSRSAFFSQTRVRLLFLPVFSVAAIGLIYFYGWPFALNPTNLWGEAIFQKGGAQGITLMVLYFVFWNISVWLCRHFPPPKFGVVHVFAQAILYVYVFHMALGRLIHGLLFASSYPTCLADGGPDLTPCLRAVANLFYFVMFSSSWLVAWVVCRYFMNLRIKIRLRRKPALVAPSTN